MTASARELLALVPGGKGYWIRLHVDDDDGDDAVVDQEEAGGPTVLELVIQSSVMTAVVANVVAAPARAATRARTADTRSNIARVVESEFLLRLPSVEPHSQDTL